MSTKVVTTPDISKNFQGNAKVQKLVKMSKNVRTGGKHSVRRRKKAKRKNTTVDDKKLQATIKKIGCNALPNIDEVSLFKKDGSVIQFTKPKVQLSLPLNVFCINGTPETKTFLPKDIAQKFGDSLKNLGKDTQTGDEDFIPPLLGQNFEEIAKKVEHEHEHEHDHDHDHDHDHEHDHDHDHDHEHDHEHEEHGHDHEHEHEHDHEHEEHGHDHEHEHDHDHYHDHDHDHEHEEHKETPKGKEVLL